MVGRECHDRATDDSRHRDEHDGKLHGPDDER